MSEPLWTPGPERVARAQLTGFIEQVRRARPGGSEEVSDFPSLYRWSVDHPDTFWPEAWRFCGVVAAERAGGLPWDEVVVGGGNIFRGVKVSEQGIPRVTGDTMGMLATVMNALALETAIERAGASARTMSALVMPGVCETYERPRALRHLEDGRVVLFAAGTGNPFFTTDTTAVLRASEIGADVVLKATDVDGVYSADPKKDNMAKRYDRLTHREALERGLKVMDATAFALAQENHMPIIVFSIHAKGAIEAVLQGQGRSTIVCS